jgi:hypothetical protein
MAEDPKSAMNMRSMQVVSDLETVMGRLVGKARDFKGEITGANNALVVTSTRVGAVELGGGPGRTSNELFPDPQFSAPAGGAVGGPAGGPSSSAGGGYGGIGSGRIFDNAKPIISGAGGNGNFTRNLTDYVKDNPSGAMLYGGLTAGKFLNPAETVVEAELLMQRAAFFQNATGAGGKYDKSRSNELFASGGSADYETIRKLQGEFAKKGTINDQMDVMRAMVAGQTYGLTGTNFLTGKDGTSAGSVMGGVANLSNLVPGAGAEGTLRAYGSMQQGRSVNMLRGIGIRIRDEQGNMKPPDQVIDDIWKKITNDYAKAYGSGATPSEQDVKIGLQPGNSMDSMLNQYFGGDPILRQMVANGLLYKARTGGAAITKSGVMDAGGTTASVLSRSNQTATGAVQLGQVSSRGSAGARGAFEVLNLFGEIFNKIDAGTGLLGEATKGKAFLETLLGGGNGANGDIAKLLLGFLGLGKAAGGPVKGDQPYLVGEKGPEIFTPKSNGVIIPNDQLKNFGGFRHAGGEVHHDKSYVVGEKGTEAYVPSSDAFANRLLGKLGAPSTATNIEAMKKWMASEGGHWNNTAGYNPLNTTLNLPGSTLMKGGAGRVAGVRHYTDWEQGLEATAITLTGRKAGERGYSAIIEAMREGKSVEEILGTINNSAWRSGKVNDPSSSYLGGAGTNGTPTASDGTVDYNAVLTNAMKSGEFQKAMNNLSTPAGMATAASFLTSIMGTEGYGAAGKAADKAASMFTININVPGGAKVNEKTLAAELKKVMDKYAKDSKVAKK